MELIPKPDPQWSSDKPDPSTSMAPFRLYNIGNHEPVDLLDVIALLEEALGRKAKRNLLPIQPGDVPATYADVESLEKATGFKPQTAMREGIQRFVKWYTEFYAT